MNVLRFGIVFNKGYHESKNTAAGFQGFAGEFKQKDQHFSMLLICFRY